MLLGVVERVIKSSSHTSSGVLGSHAWVSSMFGLLLSLLGVSLTFTCLLFHSNPLVYAGLLLVSGLVLVAATAMLSRWFRKYGRKRSRHGVLPRGQVAALFTFAALLVQVLLYGLHLFLGVTRGRLF